MQSCSLTTSLMGTFFAFDVVYWPAVASQLPRTQHLKEQVFFNDMRKIPSHNKEDRFVVAWDACTLYPWP